MIYVVIPNYSVSEPVLNLAIEAVRSFKRTAECTVVVVDDQSPIDTKRLKKEADIFIRRKENGGFAQTCNTGFEYALKQKPEYIVCANTDIEVPEGWAEEFLKLEEFGADLMGGLGYKDKGTPNPRESHNYFTEGGRMDDWMFPGGFWMMKREVLEDIGLLDPNFEHGGMEDVDFFYRAKQGGKKLMMTPKVWYWHQEGATRYSEGEIGKQNIAFQKNIDYFKQKHGFDGFAEINNILIDNRINL